MKKAYNSFSFVLEQYVADIDNNLSNERKESYIVQRKLIKPNNKYSLFYRDLIFVFWRIVEIKGIFTSTKYTTLLL